MEAIKEIARRLIAQNGVAGLSLREVSREMGLVSSALYRYFPTRDDLLTALILDAYNDLGTVVERADARSARLGARTRWRSVTNAIRRWARRNPYEYGLLFGTPVPRYVAPEATIEAATRVTRVLGRILSDDRRANPSAAASRERVGRYLEVANLAEQIPDVVDGDYVMALMAWTQIFGFLSFELFGHYVGSVRNADAFYEQVTDELASQLGLSQ